MPSAWSFSRRRCRAVSQYAMSLSNSDIGAGGSSCVSVGGSSSGRFVPRNSTSGTTYRNGACVTLLYPHEGAAG